MMNRHLLGPALVLALSASTLAGTALWAQGTADNADAATQTPSWLAPAGDPVRGEEIGAVCLACHTQEPTIADTGAPKLLHQRESYVFRALIAYRDGGREHPLMSAYADGLSDQDARDLSAFIAGEMYDVPPRARTDMDIYQRTLAQCTFCHGETGIGEYEGMPVLAGQDADYLVAALGEYASGARSNPVMQEIVAGLHPDDYAGFAEYYAAHEWLERNP